MLKTINTITTRLFVGVTAFALIVGSLPKEVNAGTGDGGSTGWERVSTTDIVSCEQNAKQEMDRLVQQGTIQKIPGWNSRFKKGNNTVFNVICTNDGRWVRVDVICFNQCADGFSRIRSKIEALLVW
ncbi:hypothetical protein [Okeania sp. SIO2B3]|uniref:hypothetical protein n=1 Tax=Okeania sp. SIO2B3 TaxID=2607784 RepID=UPI0013C18E5E|nr:hypothetical protein [Okeania sp. SIO2B3]NET41362.1 hypothetical protein [Okeania sp. SIO2B3]